MGRSRDEPKAVLTHGPWTTWSEVLGAPGRHPAPAGPAIQAAPAQHQLPSHRNLPITLQMPHEPSLCPQQQGAHSSFTRWPFRLLPWLGKGSEPTCSSKHPVTSSGPLPMPVSPAPLEGLKGQPTVLRDPLPPALQRVGLASISNVDLPDYL